MARRPPKTIALSGTPAGFSQSGSMMGQFLAGAVKRLFGWLVRTGLPSASLVSGVQFLPFQSMRCLGASLLIPSHQTSPSSVRATLVKMVLVRMESIAIGLLSYEVPGATPKKPASGLIARSQPSGPGLIQAMSSPMQETSQPSSFKTFGGIIMAKLVLPQALGKAAET